MKELITYLWTYRFVIICLMAVGLYAVMCWKDFKAKSYALMLQAKSMAKDKILKSGDQQAEWVVKKAYQFLPKSVTIFISEDLMRKIIYFLYHKAKDALDDGKINNSI